MAKKCGICQKNRWRIVTTPRIDITTGGRPAHHRGVSAWKSADQGAQGCSSVGLIDACGLHLRLYAAEDSNSLVHPDRRFSRLYASCDGLDGAGVISMPCVCHYSPFYSSGRLPHFFAIAWMCTEDYALWRFSVHVSGQSTGRQIIFFCCALISNQRPSHPAGPDGNALSSGRDPAGFVYLGYGSRLRSSDPTRTPIVFSGFPSIFALLCWRS